MNKENQIKYISKQLFEEGNIEIIDSFFTENYLAHDGEKKHSGHKFVKNFIKKIQSAINNLKIVKIEILSQTDNTLTWQRTFRGIHRFDMQGIPASNRNVKWNEMVVTRFEGEKIAEEWVVSTLAFQLMIKHKVLKS